MKHTHPFLVAGVLGLMLAAGSVAQSFDAGSNGSLGDVIVDTDTTLDLPPDGKLHYRSLTVAATGRLSFRRNTNNTPVFILAQKDIVMDGVILINGARGTGNDGGKGGPGGFDGGKPGFGELAPGNGYGPGGGVGGTPCNSGSTDANGGSFGGPAGRRGGSTYGSSSLIPLIGGSGGGGSAGSPGEGGGGGGGAVLLASNTRVAVAGTINATGGQNGGGITCFNGGSGGAIRLVAPKVEGRGLLDARGNGSGGAGRLRVDTIDRTGIGFDLQGVSSVGGNLFTFPPIAPHLNLIGLAAVDGQPAIDIPEGSGPATFTLPFGSTPNRKVRVQARDFGRNVHLRVTLTPDSGAPVVVDTSVDNSAANPAVVEVPVNVPVNTLVTVHCWSIPTPPQP